MQKIDTAELRRLHEAATKGEWAVEPVDVFGRAVLCRGARRMFPIPANDAAFMAAAHNALPALLDELEAARKELEALNVPLAVYERHTKLLGAAEELERLIGNWRNMRLEDYLPRRAAQLRQEAEDGK